jgi:hypothetical protein
MTTPLVGKGPRNSAVEGLSPAVPAPLPYTGPSLALSQTGCWRVVSACGRAICAATVRGAEPGKRRLRAAALAEVEQGDAHRLGFVGEVVGGARAREHHDADRQRFQELIVALERCCLLMPRPVRLEDDL